MPRRPPFPPLTCAALAAVVAAGGAGCSSLPDGAGGGLMPTIPGLSKKADAPDVPEAPVVQVATFFEQGEGLGESGTPVRGFHGRILLMTPAGKAPVFRDGACRLYLFSDTGTREQRAVPVNVVDLSPARWRAAATYSKLGPAFEVFVPYPKATSHAVRCSLRARFTPLIDGQPGRPLFSSSVNCTLDGPPDPSRPKNEHTMTTETISHVPEVTRLDRRAAERATVRRAGGEASTGGVRTAAAESPRRGGALDRLDPATRARMEKALAAFRETSGDGEATPPDLSRNRSPFADGDRPTRRARFDLAPGRPGRDAVAENAVDEDEADGTDAGEDGADPFWD